ncbi:hypothetical protein GCM10010252_71380 [Streptomyces aureoverticillatus]|nr:hypothetical protein GCM10010252_71380 [Streptomyces aureoverticillatus]
MPGRVGRVAARAQQGAAHAGPPSEARCPGRPPVARSPSWPPEVRGPSWPPEVRSPGTEEIRLPGPPSRQHDLPMFLNTFAAPLPLPASADRPAKVQQQPGRPRRPTLPRR